MRIVLVLTSFLVIMAIGCDGHTSVKGRVLSPDGTPIPKASVKFIQEPDTPGQGHSFDTTTDEEGNFSVGMTHAPSKTMPFLLEVSKQGFVGYEKRLTGTASYEEDIILQPAKI
jgi:hypothetical protein